MKPAFRLLCHVLCVCAMSRLCLAQSGVAQISGRVSDQSGAVLPGVLVILTDETTGHTFQTVSTGTGDYQVDFLPAGRYVLTAELPGFAPFRAEGIRIAVEQALDLQVVLKVGAPDQRITVTADSNRIETTNAAVKFSVPGEQLADLPILTGVDSRSALTSLLLMTPGSSSFNPAFAPNPSTISINGSPTNAIGFNINGISTGGAGGTVTPGPNPDAIAEYSVVAQNAKAESGTFPVIVNLETKKGGDHLHGQVRALLLNPDLSARDFFDVGKESAYSINSLGLQLSGPLPLPGLHGARGKTFFLLDQETTSSLLTYTDRRTVLSRAEREGDFSSLPAELWPTDPLTGSPFPGGRIPAARIVPQSRFFAEKIMAPASAGNEVVSPYGERPGGAQGTVRVDHQFSTSATVNASLFYNHLWYSEDNTIIQQGRVEAPGHNYSFAVQASYSFSSSAVNSFKLGQTLGVHDGIQSGAGLGIEPKSAGFNITTKTRGMVGFPIVYLFDVDYFTPGGQSSSGRESDWTVKDDFVFGRRSHFMKFGGEMRWLRATNWDNWNGTPQFYFTSFTPGGSGNDAADLLLGIPYYYAQSTDVANDPRRLHTSLYFQDDLKLRANLTLNLGIRYELAGVWSDAEGHNAQFVPGVRSSVFPNAPAGAIYPSDLNPTTGEKLGRNLNPPDHDNCGPRFGIAWSPGSDGGWLGFLTGDHGHSSVRAGYGLYYIYSRGGAIGGLASVPPWFTSVSRDASELAETGGTFSNPWGSSPDPFATLVQGRDFALPVGSLSQTDPSLVEPYQQQWNLSLQRQLPRDLTVQVAYLGNKGLHLHRTFEANPGVPTADATYSNVNSRRRYQDFGAVTGYVSDGVSTYHALQAEVSRRFASQLLFNADYIWSKGLDNASPGAGFPGGFTDRNVTTWGPSNADRRHAFLFNGVAQLPGISGVKVIDRLLSGWQAGAIVQLRSGLPIKIINPVDSLLAGYPQGTPDITGPFRKLNPRDIHTFKMPNGRIVTGNFFFDPTVFRAVLPGSPADARPGNLGRNVFTGPGVANVDMNLLKRFSVRDRHAIDLRIDTTNVFNHAQFVLYRAGGVSVTDANFGRALRTSGPRRVQFFVRYSF